MGKQVKGRLRPYEKERMLEGEAFERISHDPCRNVKGKGEAFETNIENFRMIM